MKETMGQIIRRLRKERNLTQEELAEQLNVTYQAVSRWENETGMPDISMVVPLSNVLGVSIDVLFGKDGTDGDGEIEEHIRETEIKLSNRPDDADELAWHRECCEESRKLLEKYPNNYRLLAYSLGNLNGLLSAYYHADHRDELTDTLATEKQFWENEFLREANVILHHCTNIRYLSNAHSWLTTYYERLGNYVQAEEHAKQIPALNPHQEGGGELAYLYYLLGREEDSRKQHAENILSALTYLSMQLYHIACSWRKAGEPEKAYACFRLYPDLYDLMVGDGEDEMPFYIDPCYTICAETCMQLERPDEAMDWLEKEMRHHRLTAKNYNVVTESKLPYLYGQELHYWAHTYPQADDWMTPVLADAVFDPIRGTERFQAILADAQAFERGE